MEVRKIKPEEKIFASKIQTIAFLFSRDYSEAQEHPEKFQRGYETTIAAFNDSGKMCACFESIPYQIRFDGHTVNMAGIGGVATLPEERRNGYIREIFRFAFNEMMEKEQIFSYLYPFSHVYYRKFGYELGATKQKVTIPFSEFASFPKTLRAELYQPSECPDVIKEMYNRFIQDKNLAVVRTEDLWNRWLKKDPYKDSYYTYVFYNSKNEPCAYIIYDLNKKPYNRADMMVQELIWLDTEALFGVFGFMNTFASQFGSFVWEAPDGINFHLFFPEPYNIQRQISTGGMNRIVNLQKVLELMAYPEKPGEMILQVQDNFLSWNQGTYRVSWDKGEAEVKKADGSPDFSCDIQALSQLVTGFADIQDLLLSRKVQVYNKLPVLSAVFHKKPLYLTDRF